MIPANLGMLREAARIAEDQTRRVHWDDPKETAQVLLLWDEIAALASDSRRHLAAELARAMGNERSFELPDEAVFERRVDTKETWDHPMVAGQVLGALRTIDRASGEIIDPPAPVVLDALLKAAQIAYWRLGALEELLGSKDAAHRHRTVEYRPPTVSIRRARRV